jgi:uncharacterized membrane protein YfcA
VSLWPGSLAALHAFRRELDGLRGWVVHGTLPSVAGGILGAALLLRTPERLFAWLVPWLVLFATALFALSGPLTTFARRHAPVTPAADVPARSPWPAFLVYHFFVSLYGGYFGAGIGIMMHAGLAIAGFVVVHRAIALRNYYAVLINGLAALYFVAFGAVAWGDAAVLTAGQVVGSVAGSRAARGLSPATVRWIVVAIGVLMTLSLLRRG